MAGFDDFLSALQGSAGNFMAGLSRGLAAGEDTREMGVAMQGAQQPLEASIRRGIAGEDMEFARKQRDLNQKAEYQTAVDIQQSQAEGFRKMPMAPYEGIKQGLRDSRSNLAPQASDPFGFRASIPAMSGETAAGRVANIGRIA